MKFDITKVLKTGEAEAISSKKLCSQLGITEKILKKMVHQARLEGNLIVSNRRGYFLPASNADIVAFYRTQRAHALSRLSMLKAFRAKIEDSTTP